MTTRPTDEEMDRCERMLTDCACHPDYQRLRMTDPGCMACHLGSEVIDTFKDMRAALQSIAQPIASISDVLNFLEEWALSGNILHGEDIQRFHATVERIAPIAQPVSVPDRFSRRLPKESHLCVYINGDGKCQECSDLAELELIRQRIEKAIVEHCTGGDLWLCSHLAAQHTWAMLSTSPNPQQAVPDGYFVKCKECNGHGQAYVETGNYLNNGGYVEPPEPERVLDACPTCDGVGFVSAAPAHNGKKDGV